MIHLWSFNTFNKYIFFLKPTFILSDKYTTARRSWRATTPLLHPTRPSTPTQTNKPDPSSPISQRPIKPDPGPITTCRLTNHINPPWGGCAWTKATRAWTRSTRAWTRATTWTFIARSSLRFVPRRRNPWRTGKLHHILILWLHDYKESNTVIM